MTHDSILRMSGSTTEEELASAVRAHVEAREAVPGAQEQARKLVADARASVDETRVALASAIVDAARAGMKQRDIVRITGYNRERVRQICRAAGVEPGD